MLADSSLVTLIKQENSALYNAYQALATAEKGLQAEFTAQMQHTTMSELTLDLKDALGNGLTAAHKFVELHDAGLLNEQNIQRYLDAAPSLREELNRAQIIGAQLIEEQATLKESGFDAFLNKIRILETAYDGLQKACPMADPA